MSERVYFLVTMIYSKKSSILLLEKTHKRDKYAILCTIIPANEVFINVIFPDIKKQITKQRCLPKESNNILTIF